jgi:hypothetical protein
MHRKNTCFDASVDRSTVTYKTQVEPSQRIKIEIIVLAQNLKKGLLQCYQAVPGSAADGHRDSDTRGQL